MILLRGFSSIYIEDFLYCFRKSSELPSKKKQPDKVEKNTNFQKGNYTSESSLSQEPPNSTLPVDKDFGIVNYDKIFRKQQKLLELLEKYKKPPDRKVYEIDRTKFNDLINELMHLVFDVPEEDKVEN